jgi:SSS family solute:Na+ symporter
MSGIIAAELIGTGVAIYTLSGGALSLTPAIIIAFIFALLYIFFGGILQMAWINIANSIMLIVGSFAAVAGTVVWVTKNVTNGMDGIMDYYKSAPEMGEGYLNQYSNALQPTTILSIIIPVALMHLCAIAVSQGHNMPFFAAKSNKAIRKGVYLAGVINAMSAVPWVLIGVIAFALPAVMSTLAPEEVGKLIVPAAALMMLPKPLTGLLMISLLSATLSTAGSITLGSAQLMTTNIIKDALFPKMSDKHELLLIRIMCIVYLLVCLFMALNLPVIMPVFFFCFMLNIPLFFCYITGMFITINKVTCNLTLIAGYIVAFWWTFAPPANVPYPFNDTTWAVIAVSFIFGFLLPVILKKQGKMSLNQMIKISRGQAEARIAD